MKKVFCLLLFSLLFFGAAGHITQAQDKSDSNSLMQQATKLYEQRRYNEALPLFQRAAEQGLVAAQVKLGSMYALGQGVPENEQLAVTWYKKAAAQGSQEAQEALAILVDTAKLQEEIDTQSVLRQAVNLHEQGRYEEALVIFQKEAEQGNAHAQFALGGMYTLGQGLPKNEQLAAQWLKKAAGQGHAGAEEFLRLIEKNRRIEEEQRRAEEQRRSYSDTEVVYQCEVKCSDGLFIFGKEDKRVKVTVALSSDLYSDSKTMENNHKIIEDAARPFCKAANRDIVSADLWSCRRQ